MLHPPVFSDSKKNNFLFSFLKKTKKTKKLKQDVNVFLTKKCTLKKQLTWNCHDYDLYKVFLCLGTKRDKATFMGLSILRHAIYYQVGNLVEMLKQSMLGIGPGCTHIKE